MTSLSALNDLALLAIGAFLGGALFLIAAMCAALCYSTYKQREQTKVAQTYLTHLLEQNTVAQGQLRSDVTLALSRMDAERLYDASLAIQRASKSLNSQVSLLNKAVFAQNPLGPGLDLTTPPLPESFTMDDEAADDERMLREAGRWDGGPRNHLVDPLAGLSEEEKNFRVQQFFERRRKAQAGAPMSPIADIHPVGESAYSALFDAAKERQDNPQPPALPDLGGVEAEELTDKGELQ